MRHNLLVGNRIRDLADFSVRGLFLLFLVVLYRAAFCRVLASVCEENFASVLIMWKNNARYAIVTIGGASNNAFEFKN